MIIVPDWLQTWLSTKPEYGMGYQRVSAKFANGSGEKGFVFNGQVFVKDSDSPWQLFYEKWADVLEAAHKSTRSIIDIDLISRPADTLKGIRRIALTTNTRTLLTESQTFSAKSEGGPAKDAVVTTTARDEIFKRFSPYADDFRVTMGKGLTPGTFATTKEDADANIKTGSDAVKRYALENKKPASKVFTIKPPEDTGLNRGVVEPAFGEPGGGVEVIFVNGSPDGTVTGPDTIPDT